MGAPKQKWTPEEEAALRAGVDKYGQGKWRAIQKDPKFGPVLKSRSNVDLKDKWRNLSAQIGHSRSSKVTGVTQRRAIDALMVDSLAIYPDAAAYPVQISPTAQSYDDFVLEAIATLRQPAGSNFQAIASFIEERRLVPVNFHKILTTKLKTMVQAGSLIRVDQNYKINTGTRCQRPETDDERREKKQVRKRPRMEVELAMKIMRDSELAACKALKAVAEAEEAAVAAERAVRAFEAAQAHSDALEVTWEVAELRSKKLRSSTLATAAASSNPLNNQS